MQAIVLHGKQDLRFNPNHRTPKPGTGEVLLRMTKASLFWEFGKYAVIYFILLGFSRRRSNINIHLPIFIYFLSENRFIYFWPEIEFCISGPSLAL